MARVDNEIVRFVAEVDLDPQDAAAFKENLKKAEAQCADLRKAISDTGNAMAKLRAEGKQNTAEFEKLSRQQKDNVDNLKKLTKVSESYSSALGLNNMSIRQLKDHARQLRGALEVMNKSADPKLWNKYNKELKSTEKRLKDMQIGVKGIKEPMLSFNNVMANFKTFPGILSIAALGLKAVKKAIQEITRVSQVWGDKWAVLQAGLHAGWDHLVRWVTSRNRDMLASTKEVVNAAREAAALRDELFEKNNSLKIEEAKNREEIAELGQIYNDSTKSAEERLDAYDKVLDIERKLAEYRMEIALQEKEVAVKDMESVKITPSELEMVVDGYLANQNMLNQAKEYAAKQDELAKKRKQIARKAERAKNSGSDSKASKEYWALVAEADALEQSLKDEYYSVLQDTGQNIASLAQILAKYDMLNDNLIEPYVKARVAEEAAEAGVDEVKAGQMRKRSAMQKQIADDEARAREDEYNNALAAAEKAYKSQLVLLKEQLEKKAISEMEYNAKSMAMEMAMLNEKNAVMAAYGKDTSDIESQILDKRLSQQKAFAALVSKDAAELGKFYEQLEKEASMDIEDLLPEDLLDFSEEDAQLQAWLEERNRLVEKAQKELAGKTARIQASDAAYDRELSDLQQLNELKLISEEEYLARKKRLNEEHAKELAEINTESWTKSLSLVEDMVSKAGELVKSAQEAEYATLDAWKEKQLTLAGDNAERREKIESDYEARKLAIQKKYADMDMGISIAKAVAAGALATIQAWTAAAGNPVVAGIYTALIAATTAAEVATIVAQRNAIKGMSTSSSASLSSASNVIGFSEGGYTGDGARMEVAGVVHRGEYVVPQPEMRDPYVRSILAEVEARRRHRTSKNALPGYAEGGYTGMPSGSAVDSKVLREILEALQDMRRSPIPAYTVLSEFEARQKLRDRFRSETSLRRRQV